MAQNWANPVSFALACAPTSFPFGGSSWNGLLGAQSNQTAGGRDAAVVNTNCTGLAKQVPVSGGESQSKHWAKSRDLDQPCDTRALVHADGPGDRDGGGHSARGRLPTAGLGQDAVAEGGAERGEVAT